MTEKTERTFDASRHLVKLKGRDYLEVKWRLLWLRTEHPDAHIETELFRLAEGFAVFKAQVSIPDAGSATGWGSEEAEDFPDFLEKAETKALGRALAALGFGTQFTEDYVFERDGEQALVDSPVRRPEFAEGLAEGERVSRQSGGDRPGGPQRAAVAGAAGGGQATPAQVNAIYAIGRREYRWSDEETDSYCRNAYGKLPGDLTKREASEFIDRLKATAPAA